MDWNALRNKRTSVSGVSALPKLQLQQAHARFPMANNYTPPNDLVMPSAGSGESRVSYYASQHPLFCADWISKPEPDLVALLSFREGFQNRIQVVHGQERFKPGESYAGDEASESAGNEDPETDGFDFSCVAETLVDYPVTCLQWEPGGHGRLGASLEILRLYKYLLEYGEPSLIQTHLLANNSTANAANASAIGTDPYDINSFPPVTSFDWNATDPSIIITLSVDTTCTVWDLAQSHSMRDSHNGLAQTHDTAQVKTQLIAHDSEVFDVKFLHMSTNVFASVSNDGSMRVFDLRSLEHSTIIYEPTGPALPLDSPAPAPGSDLAVPAPALNAGAHYNLQALIRLLASNVDQHNLATVGVHLNQVLIIDLRMPGVPVMTVDALFGGKSHTAVNLIKWHPSANLLATGGDDCQALVWDCSGTMGHHLLVVIDTPVLAYAEDLEVNTVCWRRDSSSWMGVVSGKGFQALEAR